MVNQGGKQSPICGVIGTVPVSGAYGDIHNCIGCGFTYSFELERGSLCIFQTD